MLKYLEHYLERQDVFDSNRKILYNKPRVFQKDQTQA